MALHCDHVRDCPSLCAARHLMAGMEKRMTEMAKAINEKDQTIARLRLVAASPVTDKNREQG